MSNNPTQDAVDTYLATITERADVAPEEIVRHAAEEGLGVIAAIQMLMGYFRPPRKDERMGLAEAKTLVHTLCAEHNLRPVYEAACRARDPGWPHGRGS
jgi:hypothetical protein